MRLTTLAVLIMLVRLADATGFTYVPILQHRLSTGLARRSWRDVQWHNGSPSSRFRPPALFRMSARKCRLSFSCPAKPRRPVRCRSDIDCGQRAGIFTIPATGQGNAILVFINPATNAPAIAGPTTASLGYPSAPIPRGTGAFFYVTGLGAMTPSVPDGSGTCPAPNGICNANAMPTVLVGGITAQVAFAGQAPEFPGVFQVNITIPQAAPAGDAVSLVIVSADGSVTSNTATIAVQ